MPPEMPGASVDRPTVVIAADHGLAVVYFLPSDVIDTLLGRGIEVQFLTDDALTQQIETRWPPRAESGRLAPGSGGRVCGF